MTLRPTLAAPALTLGIVLISSFLAAAETPRKKPKKDPVADAIHRFKTRDKTTPNEVSVVLGNDDEQPPTAVQVGDDSKPADASTAEGSPVMVTGKPQADIDPAATSASTPEPPQPTEEPPKPKLEEDLAVRVERVRSGNGTIDPAQIVLTAPFPAKPLTAVPSGWHLDISESAPPFTRDVDFAPGAPLTLTIRPHILVPDADGVNVFTVSEPGYHYPLGYRQTTTVGAILSNSIRQLDDDSKKLGNAIDNLQQLLSSLPKQEQQEQQAQPEAKPAILRKK